MVVFMVYNLKGGVGKTTSCVNLSYLAAKEGFKTLVWDLDPQGACSYYFNNQKPSNLQADKLLQKKATLKQINETAFSNLDLLPSTEEYRNLVSSLTHNEKGSKKLTQLFSAFDKEYQVLFIDCPPTFSQLADELFLRSDFIIMPSIPSTLSERASNQIQSFLDQRKFQHLKLMSFYNLVDTRKKLHKTILSQRNLSNQLKTFIKSSSIIENMGLHQKPLNAYDNSDAAKSYATLWDEIKTLYEVAKKLKIHRIVKQEDRGKWIPRMLVNARMML